MGRLSDEELANAIHARQEWARLILRGTDSHSSIAANERLHRLATRRKQEIGQLWL